MKKLLKAFGCCIPALAAAEEDTVFFAAAFFLAGALRAVVFLAATGPPRGKTLGLPEGSLNQECQT